MAAHGARTKRRVVCENSRFFIYLDDWTHDGQQVHDYLVVAPKLAADDFVTGVAILPIFEEKFGLLRIFRHAVEADCWEVPRGFVEPDESEAASALRELTEETGLCCTLDRLQSLGLMTPDAGILAARVHLYAATGCSAVGAFCPDEFGHQELRFFNRAEMDDLIARSEIQDPCTLIAYFKFQQTAHAQAR